MASICTREHGEAQSGIRKVNPKALAAKECLSLKGEGGDRPE